MCRLTRSGRSDLGVGTRNWLFGLEELRTEHGMRSMGGQYYRKYGACEDGWSTMYHVWLTVVVTRSSSVCIGCYAALTDDMMRSSDVSRWRRTPLNDNHAARCFEGVTTCDLHVAT